MLKFKSEERKVKNRIFENNLQLHAHNASGFDTRINLKNLPCDQRFVDIIRKGKDIIELVEFNGYVQKNKKQTPQYLHFRCGVTHLNYSLRKLGKTFNFHKELLKNETR